MTGNVEVGIEIHDESVGAPGRGRRRVSIDDKNRLAAALATVEAWRDPTKRQSVLDELAEALGAEFDPARFNATAPDTGGIVSTCVRLRGMRELVSALRLYGAATDNWRMLSDLVNSMFPETLLNPADRRHLAQLLAGVPDELVQRALSSVWGTGQPGLTLRSHRDRGRMLEELEQHAVEFGHADRPLWLFLEAVAHALDETTSRELHHAIHGASQYLGDHAYAMAREVCATMLRPVEATELVEAADPDSVTSQELPEISDMLLPSADSLSPGEDDVKANAIAATAPGTSSGSVPAVFSGVPPRNPFFTGRVELLDEIWRQLRSNVRTTLPSPTPPPTLHGLGGVGKSQIAIEYAYRFQSDYDLVWWVPAADANALRRSLDSMARRLGFGEAGDTDVRIEAVLDELRVGRQYRRWLVIFDDAAEPEVVRPYLPQGGGHLLITSRDRGWKGPSTIVEVDTFRPAESVEFLIRRWEGLSPPEAARLAELLGHLPLALDQAVAVHVQTGMPLEEYLRLLEEEPVRVLGRTAPTEYPQPVAKTLRLAFDHLADRNMAAAQVLQIAAFLSSHPIEVPLLREGRKAANLPSPLAVVIKDELAFRETVRDIGRYALAQIDEGRDFLTLHTLVRAVLRDALGPEERARTEGIAHEVLALANPGSPDKPEEWKRHKRVAPHVIPSGVVHSPDDHVRQILIDQIRYHFVTGDFKTSRDLARAALQSWRERHGPDELLTLRATFHLGNALRVLGEYDEARQLTQDTYQRLERLPDIGPNHAYTLYVANSITADLRIGGEFERARTLDEENLARHRDRLGADDPSTLRAANNLAVDHRLLGQFRKAMELDQDNVDRRTRLDPAGKGPESLLFLDNLVRDLYGLGEYSEALKLQQERLPAFEAEFGERHRAVLMAHRNLAILWRKTGNYEEARREAEASFQAFRAQFGPRHLETLASATTLFNTLRVVGDLVLACRVGEETHNQYSDAFGDQHPAALACAVNLAIVYRALGEWTKAGELDQRTLADLRDALGEDHPYTLCCAANMTNNLAHAERTEEARKLSEDVVVRSRRVRGPDNPYTLACAANLTLDLEATGAHAEAKRLRAETLAAMQLRLGAEHPQTVSVERQRRTEADTEIPPM